MTLAGALLHAQDKPEATGSGTIEGRVLNGVNGQYLNSARVYIEKTSIEVYTNDAGEYVLRNVPAGEVYVSVSYTGQTTLTKSVTVLPGETVKKHFTFNSPVGSGSGDDDDDGKTLVLDTFVVEQKRLSTARERAIQEERAATNIKSVVAADSLGYNPDGNVGEFVRFLTGVDVSEGGTYNNPSTISGVSVRGFGSDSTAILVDGMPLASAPGAGLTRSTQIDMVSINNADRIEVIKVATPDMRQDSPGGAINLISRGAFELAKPSYTYSIAFNGQSHTASLQPQPGPFKNNKSYKILPTVRVSATVPLSKTLGFSASVASDNRTTYTQYAKSKDWIYRSPAATVRNAKGIARIDNPAISGFQVYANDWVEYRQSGNIRLDWRPVPGLTIRANGQFSQATTYSADRRNEFKVQASTDILDWGTDGSYMNGRNGRLQQTIVTRDKNGFTNSGYIQADYNLHGWTIGAKVSASESYGAYDDVDNGHFSGLDSPTLSSAFINFEGIKNGAPGKITMWNSVGEEINYSNYNAWGNNNRDFTVRSGQAFSRDLMKQYNLDVARDLDFLPFRSSIKMGVYRGEKGTHKWGSGLTYSYQYIGQALTASEISTDFSTPAVYGYKDRQYWVDTYKLYNIYQANPASFDENYVNPTTNVNLQANNHNSKAGQSKGITETSTEWYMRLDGKFFNSRLHVITGFRESKRSVKGYNLFRDSKSAYVKLPDGTPYRDAVGVGPFTNGVRFDGGRSHSAEVAYAPNLYNSVLTDTALIARMRAAGVVDLPTQLELSPSGTAVGTTSNNLKLAQLYNATREIRRESKNPGTPQLQLAYKVTDDLKVQASWSRETRLPDLEGTNTALLSSGGDFTFNQADPTSATYNDVGGQGVIRISNVKNQPEITNSYNFRASYYTKYGSYSATYYLKITPKQWQDELILPGDPDYASYINSVGLDPSYYDNMTITTSTATGEKGKRTGIEIELQQNFGFLGTIGERFNAALTYNHRSVPANSRSGSSILGYSRQNPVRDIWTGNIQYSAPRYSLQMKWKYTQPGRTNMASTAVTLPDGTNSNVMFYRPNNKPVTMGLQFNYVISKNLKFFTSVDKLFETETFTRNLDMETGMLPHYASFTQATKSGRTVAMGITGTF